MLPLPQPCMSLGNKHPKSKSLPKPQSYWGFGVSPDYDGYVCHEVVEGRGSCVLQLTDKVVLVVSFRYKPYRRCFY